jgi:hypothetical protein
MNWRKDLFRFSSCSRCAGLFAVSVFLWRWVLASSQEFAFTGTPPTPIKVSRSHLTWMARWWRSTAPLAQQAERDSRGNRNPFNAETATIRRVPLVPNVIDGDLGLVPLV